MGLFRLTIAAACIAFSLNAIAGADDIVWTLRNSTDSGPRTTTPAHPTTCFGIPAYNYLTLAPVYFCPGAGLTLSVGTPGTIAVDVPSSGNASSTQIVKGNDTRLTDNRSTTSTLITDSTSIGRQVLTASDAAAVRSLLDVSPSSFDGAYSSLTGIPSTFTPSTHTHTASQISDSTAVGRALMVASSSEIARIIVGAGTSSYVPEGTSTDYLDGTGVAKPFPSIPSAQVNTDWNATSGVQQLVNKPSTFPPSTHTHPVSQISDSTVTGQALVTAVNAGSARTTLGLGSSSLLDVATSGDATSSQVVKGNDGRLTDARTPLAHDQAWSTITGTPTTLSGFGITDGITSSALSSTLSGYVSSSSLSSTLSNYVTSSSLSSTLSGYPTSSSLSSTLSGYVTSSDLSTALGGYVTSGTLSGYATTSAVTSGLAGKLNTPTGTTSQFLDGTGAPKNFSTTLTGYGITDAYPLTGNPSGFLTSVTSGQISTALGFTPYNGSTNPNGFLTGITGSQVTTALGYTPVNPSALSGYVPTTRTINGQALSSNVTLAKADIGLGNVANTDTTNASNISTGTLATGRLPTGIDAANVGNGTVSNSEFQALDGVTSAIQTQINGKFTTPTGTTSQYLRGDGTTATFPDLSGYATTSALTAGLAGKFNTPAGTVSQCVRGDGSVGTCPGGTVTSVGITSSDLTVGSSPVTSSGNITLALPNTGTAGTYSLVTTDAKGRVTSGTNMSINDAPARSLVTSTSATGFQVSATRNARVCYEGTVSTTSTIGGPASATVFLETAATNSTTPGDWTVKARQTYSNTITLAVVLNQVQLNNWSMCRDIPAGLYVRIRSGSVTGTASVSLNSEQQESVY